MALPLAGRRIVITRPREQAQGLTQALREQGAEVLAFPVLAIAPLTDLAPLQVLAGRLGQFDLAFFVSPNSVAQALAVLDVATWPPHLAVATVGPASARALVQHGFREVIVPTERFDSEAVLALPQFQAEAVAGRAVLVLRGDGGRELLAESLLQRGARVEQVSCYQRSCAANDPAPLVECYGRGELDGVVFSSSEGVSCFLRIAGPAGQDMLRTLPVFAPHPRIVAVLRDAGATQACLTAAGDEGIVSTLVARLAGP